MLSIFSPLCIKGSQPAICTIVLCVYDEPSIYLVQKETQCFYLHFWGVKIIDFKNNFISVVLPCYKDLDSIVPSYTGYSALLRE